MTRTFYKTVQNVMHFAVTHEEAEAKALGEYEKYWRIQDQKFLSDFDKFIEGLK